MRCNDVLAHRRISTQTDVTALGYSSEHCFVFYLCQFGGAKQCGHLGRYACFELVSQIVHATQNAANVHGQRFVLI